MTSLTGRPSLIEIAKVSPDGIAQEYEVLLVIGLVGAQLCHHPVYVFLRGVFVQHERDRVTRRAAEYENNQGDGQQRNDGQD